MYRPDALFHCRQVVAGFVRRDDRDADLALDGVAGLDAAAGAHGVTERVAAGHAALPLALKRRDLAFKWTALGHSILPWGLVVSAAKAGMILTR
jgi:hypothetical protein